MIHRILLTSFTVLTLAACQNQNTAKDTTTSTTVRTQSNGTVPKKTGEPQMSNGLPPDKEAVDRSKTEAGMNNSANSTVVYLKEGENKFIKEHEMTVTFKQISEDNRCPQGVNCIWAGVATADVEVMGLYTRPMTLKLSTMDVADRGYTKSQNFNGSNISLVSVTPETTSDKGHKALKGSYTIGIKITKDNGSRTTQSGTTTR